MSDSETEGLIPRPADVIGQLDYEINRGGNSATINAMIAARDELRNLQMHHDFWKDAAKANLDFLYKERDRAEAALADAVKAEREAICIVFDGPPSPEAGRFVEVETDDGKSINIGQWSLRDDGFWQLRIEAAAIRARGEKNG